MNFNKLTISDLVDQQLPSFIVDEFPTFVKFFEEYYKSLEVSGGVLDIQNNFLEYSSVDNLRKFNLVKTYKLESAIDASATSIVVDKIDGLSTDGGVIGIGSEIIQYESVNISTRTLTGCKRGFTATTTFDNQKTTVQTSTAQSHAADAVVTNYSNLILFFVLKNYEEQYLAGFPHENISDQIGKDTLIRNIKDFYSYKGTDLSVEFLFRALFDEEITIRYPKDRVIKASYSDFTVDDIIKVESIQGNPYDLVGAQVRQTDASGVIQATAIIDDLLINNISNYSSGSKNIYEVRLNVLDSQPFDIPQESILRSDISATDTVITVDSTLSFPESNGVIEIDGEFITYRTKTFNQFIDCGRGVYGTNAAAHFINQEVRTTEYIFGYAPGKTEVEDQIRMKVLGVLSEVDIIDGSNYFDEGERITLSEDGASDSRPQFTSWKLNEVGNRSSSSENQINDSVKDIPTEVFAIFKDSKYAYVTSAGLPGHPIGGFIGTGFDIRNQNILKSFPLVQEKNTQVQIVGSKPVGLFVNGVEAFSPKDYEEVPFGPVDSVSIAQSGFGFEENIQPIFRVKDSTGNGATFNADIVDGRVTNISVVNGGSDYTSDHELEVTYGFNATASITQDAHLKNGEIKTITVASGGQDYVATPNVEITDTSGRGKGAFAIAEVTNNQVTGIIVLNGGTDYTDKSTIQVRIVSKGSGVFATANVKKWSFDRVFKTKYVLDVNQNWTPATQVKSDLGNGYLYASRNAAYGLQYGYPQNPKILRSQLVDNVLGVNANYGEKPSGYVHSPILGWAYDGNPIYGPYGYSNPVDENSSITRQTSSYALKSSVSATRPNTTKYPLGAFVDDYEFVQGNGTLDFNNGRFCKTPEYPDGRYCYFLTVNSFGSGVYPYIVGESFQSVPAENNYDLEFDQSNDSNIPTGARRIRTSNTPSKGFDASLVVGSVERGSVDSFAVTESGNTFKNNDFLYIDNTDTEGSRLFGRVFEVNGKTVPRVSYQVAPGQSIPTTNGIPTAPWPIDVSAPQYMGTKFAVTAETSEPHGLSENDLVTLSLDLNNVNITKNFKVRVSDYQTITYNKPSITTSLVADVAFNATNLNITIVDAALFRENDYIKINDEILKITAIDTNSGQLTVDRNQFSTPLRLHAATNTVTLHIPDDQPDYRIAVGDAITSPGVAGVVYQIDKENSTIDVRVTSGTITNAINITDTSTPTGRQIDIADVTGKSVYWEIDPTGTGNYYARDLQFRFIRGSKYVFDLSDGSNLNHNLIFSEDSSNVNTLANVTYVGTPGTPGASATIEKIALLDTNVSRVYYYDEKNGVLNNKKYFSVLLLPAGTQKVKIVDSTKFQFFAPFQPEVTEWLNLISYKTTSLTSTGSISSISVIDGGEGYKKLPKIEGVTHSLLDDFRGELSLVSGSVSSITILNGGSRYSASTKIFINTTTGSGAKLTPVIVNERIISVTVDDPGDGYAETDTITAVDTDVKIYAEGADIGKVKTVRFSNNGSQFTSDRTLSKSLLFNKKVIVKGLGSNIYKLAEVVTTTGGFEGKIQEIKLIGNEIYLLNLFVVRGELKVGDVLNGQINQYTSTVEYVTNPDIVGLVNAYIGKVGFYDSDLGKISSSSQKITDSNYFQDFSYVIRSTRSLNDYKQYVDETTHPLGFKLFGEVAVENDVDFEDTVTGNPFSIGLADDANANEVIILLPDINVESDIVLKKYEVSTIKTANIKAYGGTGAARLNFLDNQIESTKMADLSGDFDGARAVFSLSTNDGNFPTDTSNTSVMIALNEIFQEPYQTQNITGISYDAGMMTVTTDGNHGLAVTVSGTTYPDQKYVHISGVVNSIANINFNDKFEIYDVPTSNSFRALISNPNGTLTNNNPAVCADVQSTIDNLTTILTYYTANPSATRPIRNIGIWTDPTKGPVSANRHRDGANLINANKFEIIDRANAEISLQYPDFFYPNDPQTNGYSRYRDAYRLIITNRKELVDRGAAQIAVDYPDFVYPLDPTTASDYRFKDAYRLIQQNRTEIVNNSWNAIIAQYPSHGTYETKCKRDMGLFIDYTSLDLVNGGNEYARKFALQFFDDSGNPITNGILGEEEEAIFGFNAAKDNMILAFTNQLTVTDTTITPDPAGAPLCANVTSAITVLSGIVTDAFTAGSIAGLPAETIGSDRIGEAKCKRDIGLFVDAMALDIHTGGNVYARKFLKQYFNATGTSFITNGLDGEILQSVTAFEKVRDLMKEAIVNQLLEKDLTITSANANYWGTTVGTPTNVTYDAVTGAAQVTITNHGLSNGDDVVLKSNSLTFTCGMDGHVAEKSYPRLADGNHEQSLAVSNVTTDTFDITVGASPEKTFTITNADYDPVSGDVELTIGNHSLRAGTSVKIEPESITFTCSQDNDATEHSYPKSEILTATVDNAVYNPSDGVLTVTVEDHGWENGDFIKFDDDSLVFTCARDNNQTEHAYPRSTDPVSGKWIPIYDVYYDSFKVKIGVSSDTSAHTFVRSVDDGLKKKKDKTFDTAVPIVTKTATTITINVGSSTDTSVHTYVPRLYTVTDATYDPTTGILGITSANHGFTAGDGIIIGDGSLTFSCAMDGNTSNKTYPRSTDPASNKRLNVISATNDQLTVNIGASPLVSFTPTGADYNPTTGLMELTIGNHNLTAGTSIKLLPNSLVFTCDEDNNQTNHSYPRSTDPFYDTAINIESVTATTITIQVLSTVPSTNTTTHTFVSATTGAVVSGGNYTHTFVSATSNALNQAVVISGSEYPHTFIRAANEAIVRPVVNSPVANNSNGACADVQSNIDNVVGIVTTYLNQGSLVTPLALPIESMRVPSFGEGKCKRDLGIIVDAIIADMRSGGNSNILDATERYIDGTSLLTNGIAGELAESTTAFNKARDMAKLAITNQLYNKDFTILPDFLTTSGTLDSADVTNALYTEGQYKYDNSSITFYEKPKTGTTFYSTFFKFIDGADDARYSYKIKDILFDSTTKTYDLLKKNGTNVVTEADENLLIFVDGVMQIYGESYTINRSVNPNQIVFNEAFERERHFFGYTFSKYKILNNFSHLLDGSRKSFELQFGDDNIIPPDVHQILVLLDGVPQAEGVSYNITDNVLTFTEAPQVGKNCHCLYFYGKTFDKTISIWNGNVFENLEYIGRNSPDGCRYLNKVANTGDIIQPGDLIKIDGETPKEIIRIDEKALENTDNLLYTAFVYTDNAYIRGKNAVANAVVTGVTVSGGNTVGIEDTVGINDIMGIPPVFDYQVTGVNITNPGLEYDVAPEVLFKVTCDNPGTGAEAYAEITNGKVTNVVITNPGSGYTSAPELIFAKKYEIVRPHTPLFFRKDIVVDYTAEGGNAGLGFTVNNESEIEDLRPLVVSQISAERTTHVQTQVETNRDTSQPGLAHNLNTFDQLKFQFEPIQLNDPLANYLGTGVTIEHMTRYAPNITIEDFTTHAGVAYGSAGGAIINIPTDAYVSYGLTLNGAINDAVTTVTVTGNVANFPPAGYLEFGDETMEYTSISGQDFTVTRGAKSTTATAHADGDYLRLAWRG